MVIIWPLIKIHILSIINKPNLLFIINQLATENQEIISGIIYSDKFLKLRKVNNFKIENKPIIPIKPNDNKKINKKNIKIKKAYQK
ncbi:hypothetical protein SKUN_001666 [Spiroplasma kunkelii CR2-3x]|uniref:Uncharacterized protein n=1 Tax=Spiroplasma kunkelii CR2-3x TaxID=273035 RepID=A0A0K2JJA1_SPIKU|nr:hypothetical protein [Spiroplasma kunkelii]ALA98523.1 hypothetical protein SKUN_001666 [Spiroplasma kunkelii CR2-3x]